MPTDGVILDLEDSVAPDAKEARAPGQVAEVVKAGGFGRPRGVHPRQRHRHEEEPWHADDLDADVQAAPRTPFWCRRYRSIARYAGGDRPAPDGYARRSTSTDLGDPRDAARHLQHFIELPQLPPNSKSRLAGFVMGTNDLAKDTRARLVPGRAPMLPWLMCCLAAARPFGLVILDEIYNDIGDSDGFARNACRARAWVRRQDPYSS